MESPVQCSGLECKDFCTLQASGSQALQTDRDFHAPDFGGKTNVFNIGAVRFSRLGSNLLNVVEKL